MENLDDHGCPKFRGNVDPKASEDYWIIELRIQTQDHSSLCSAQGEIVW